MTENKASLIIQSPEGDKTYDIWDSFDLEETFLELGKERLENSNVFYTEDDLLNQLQYAVENDLGHHVYEVFLTARDMAEPYSDFEFVDEEGNGEPTYDELVKNWEEDTEL